MAYLALALWVMGIGTACVAVFLFRSADLYAAVYTALGAIALVGIGSALPARSKFDGPPPLLLPGWAEWVGIAVVLALAIAVRFVGLTDVPPYIFVDEAHKAIDAAAIAEGAEVSPFTVGWWGVPTLYFYYASWFIEMFGRTELGMRAPCSVSGLLAVIFVYLAARIALGVRWGLVAALLIAGSRWHFNFSRWGGEEIAMPAMWALCLVGLVWAFRARPRWLTGDAADDARWYSPSRLGPAALGGLGLGLLMYTYAAARLLPFAVGLFLLHQAVLRRGFFRRDVAAAVLVVVVSAAVFGPLAWDFYRHPDHVMRRVGETSVFHEIEREESYAPLWRGIGKHLLMFHGPGDRNGRHNLPLEPMLDVVSGAMLLVGCGMVIGRLIEPLPALCLLGAVFSLSAGVLTNSGEAPQAFRTAAVVPVLAIVCAMAWAGLCGVVWRALPSRAIQWWLWGMGTTAAIVACVLNITLYFGPQMSNANVITAFNPEPTMGAREVHAIYREDPDRQVYVWPQLYGWATLHFLEPEKHSGSLLRQFEPSAHLPLVPSEDADVSIFLEPAQQEERREIERFYQDVQWQERRVPELDSLAYLRCDVPAASIAAMRGLNAVYQPLNGGESVERRDTRVALDPSVPDTFPPDMEGGFDVAWKGCLASRHAQRARLVLVTTDGARYMHGTVLLNDDVVYRRVAGATEDGDVREVSLAPGVHALEVRHTYRGADGGVRLALTRDNGALVDVPEGDLFAYPLPPNGLLATYYRGLRWSGEPLFRRKDRQVEVDMQVGAPISVLWEGYFKVEQPGRYRFEPNSDDGCEVFIGDQRVGHDPGPTQGQRSAVPIQLDAGFHPIRVKFWDKGGGRGLTVWMYPPVGGRVKLPGQLLYPRIPDA